MNKQRLRLGWPRALFVLCLFFAPGTSFAQGLGPYDRDNARAMLSMIKDDLKSNYYDRAYRGMNLDERFSNADARIKTATNRDQLMVIVAQTLLELNDSHTFLIPPPRAAR